MRLRIFSDNRYPEVDTWCHIKKIQIEYLRTNDIHKVLMSNWYRLFDWPCAVLEDRESESHDWYILDKWVGDITTDKIENNLLKLKIDEVAKYYSNLENKKGSTATKLAEGIKIMRRLLQKIEQGL